MGELGCQQPGYYSGDSIQGLKGYALKGELVCKQPGHYLGDSIQGLKGCALKGVLGSSNLGGGGALFR
jgi:hypothetical protein